VPGEFVEGPADGGAIPERLAGARVEREPVLPVTACLPAHLPRAMNLRECTATTEKSPI